MKIDSKARARWLSLVSELYGRVISNLKYESSSERDFEAFKTKVAKVINDKDTELYTPGANFEFNLQEGNNKVEMILKFAGNQLAMIHYSSWDGKRIYQEWLDMHKDGSSFYKWDKKWPD